MVPIQDQKVVATSGDTHYRNVQFTGIASDVIKGTVFKVTMKELEKADVYEEDAGYKRLLVQLASGITAWVYLKVLQ